ncbi:hypothetical protein [Shewanella mangrovi]|uniref:hypothetical protein n=1 Tax=Shewanella mangrovi TaxID=1515746 RepID=UPI000B0D9751|nr:hypothetical protein [Shewanella mangrovi]
MIWRGFDNVRTLFKRGEWRCSSPHQRLGIYSRQLDIQHAMLRRIFSLMDESG